MKLKLIKYLFLAIFFVPVLAFAKPQIGHVCIGGHAEQKLQKGCVQVRKRLTDCGFDVKTVDIGQGEKLFDTHSKIKEKLREISELPEDVPAMISSHSICGTIAKVKAGTDKVIFNMNKAPSYKDFYFCQTSDVEYAEVGNLLAIEVDKRSLVAGTMIASLIKGNCNRPLYVSACRAGALVCNLNKVDNIAVSCKHTESSYMDNDGVDAFEAAVVELQCLSIAPRGDFDAYDEDKNNILDSTEVNRFLEKSLAKSFPLDHQVNTLELIKNGLRVATPQEEIKFIKNCRQNGALKDRANEDLTLTGNIQMIPVMRNNDSGLDTCVYNGTNSQGRIETWTVPLSTTMKPQEEGYLNYPDKSKAPKDPRECFDPNKREARPECALYALKSIDFLKQPDCAQYMDFLSNSSYPKTCPCPSGTCSDCWTTATGVGADVSLSCYTPNTSPRIPGELVCKQQQHASTYNITVKKRY